MGIPETKAALAAVLATATGIVRAEAYAPRSIAAADLPCALVFTGPATYDDYGPDPNARRVTRTYTVRVYVTPIAGGLNGEAEAAVEPFFDAVRDVLAASPTLNRTVLQARLLRDNGVQVFNYAGSDYLGCELQAQVIDIES